LPKGTVINSVCQKVPYAGQLRLCEWSHEHFLFELEEDLHEHFLYEFEE